MTQNLFDNAPFKKILVLDAETAWCRKQGLSLSVQTTEEYIRDPRFKVWGFCIKEYGEDKARTQWYRHDEMPRILATYDWSTTAVAAQNSMFDVAILEWLYDVHPCFIFDTLSMARAVRGVLAGNGLAQLAHDYGLPPKGDAVYSTEGILDVLPAHIEQELAAYCAHDVFLCEELFKRLLPGYPLKELRLIDLTLKMFTRPQLRLDEVMLRQAIDEEARVRTTLMEKLQLTDSVLASNDKFAEVLRSLNVIPPTKTSPTTGKDIFAFAKSDAKFQALLHGDREDVSMLCEARLKVKSTLERTRAQRFLDISQRGLLPVPLSYYGAATGRYAAAKGSQINMQNMKRGSFLRKAILAPAGHKLVVGDLSQIEPRVLGWLAGYEELLNIFRSGQDAYAMFGRQMFNDPSITKESAPELRQSAKSALLGCFGADTLVLTRRGWVPIVSVQATDTVWDGASWVTHRGVVQQGEKEVLTALGISATADHEILTERGWAEWSEVLASPYLLTSALSLANSPVLVGNVDPTGLNGKGVLPTSQKCVAPVVGKVSWNAPTFAPGAQHGAMHAQKHEHTARAWLCLGLRPYAQTQHTENVCSRGLARSSAAALTKTTSSTQTTGVEVLACINRGLKTALRSCATWLGLTGGISPTYSLIGATTSAGMSQATFALSRAVQTQSTNAASEPAMLKNSSTASRPLKQRMQTYDIAYAGPRNRYTILTDAGPLIVHNCGYGLGWASFAQQLLTGFLGAPPVQYKKDFARKLGVTSQHIERFMGYEPNLESLATIQANCSQQELLIHCLAAARIIEIYRGTAAPVTEFWELMTNLIARSLHGGEEFNYKDVLLFRKGEIVMPNGMSLRYPNIQRGVDEKGRPQWTYGANGTKLYAGKITNNVTQGLARIVMTDGMLRTSRRYFVAGTVHDEQIVVVPEQEAEEGKTWVLEQMTRTPVFLPGIPLAAEGGVHERYGLAKG